MMTFTKKCKATHTVHVKYTGMTTLTPNEYEVIENDRSNDTAVQTAEDTASVILMDLSQNPVAKNDFVQVDIDVSEPPSLVVGKPCEVCHVNIGETKRGCFWKSRCPVFVDGDCICKFCFQRLYAELRTFYPAPGNGLPAMMRMARVATTLPKRFDKNEAVTLNICMGQLIVAYKTLKSTSNTSVVKLLERK
jgi:hypothetical protein